MHVEVHRWGSSFRTFASVVPGPNGDSSLFQILKAIAPAERLGPSQNGASVTVADRRPSCAEQSDRVRIETCKIAGSCVVWSSAHKCT